jgi:hypothetical protein
LDAMKLLDHFVVVARRRRLARKTIDVYLGWVKQFLAFCAEQSRGSAIVVTSPLDRLSSLQLASCSARAVNEGPRNARKSPRRDPAMCRGVPSNSAPMCHGLPSPASGGERSCA